jgi:hypothetical protein
MTTALVKPAALRAPRLMSKFWDLKSLAFQATTSSTSD